MAPTSTPKGTKWNEEAHKSLVGALLDVMDANSISIAKDTNSSVLTTSMARRGHTFTYEGLRQHLQKLKKKDAAASPGGAVPGGAVATSSKKPAVRSNKKRAKAASDDDEEGGEGAIETPSKKPKPAPKAKAKGKGKGKAKAITPVSASGSEGEEGAKPLVKKELSAANEDSEDEGV